MRRPKACGRGNTCEEKEKKGRKVMYLEIRLVKQYGMGDRCILLMLRL